MEIQYFGQSCFRLRGKETVIVTDPYQVSIGLKLPSLSADMITISHNHDDHNNVSGIKGTERRPIPLIIDQPGEYEAAGAAIYGINSLHGNNLGENTIFIYRLDGLTLVHLGDLGTGLTDKQMDNFDEVDVLFVPVGGKYTLDSDQALAVVKQIEPKIIIPMHYQLPKLTVVLDPVENFLKEFDQGKIQKLDKLVINDDKLPEEQQVIVFNARS